MPEKKRDGPFWFEKMRWKTKPAIKQKNAINDFAQLWHPQPRSLISLGTMDSGNLFRGKKIERQVFEILGPWPQMFEMLVLKLLKNMSANFRDIPANFRDIPTNFRDRIFFFWGFLQQKCGKPVFNPS